MAQLKSSGYKPMSAYDKIIYYLSRRDHSEKELVQKMRRKYSVEEIQQALAKAKAKNWITPPDRLSQKMAESLHRKLKGHMLILKTLKEKGLPPIVRDLQLEVEKAADYLQKYLRIKAKRVTADIQKLQRALLQRGFDSETIRKVMNDYKKQLGE